MQAPAKRQFLCKCNENCRRHTLCLARQFEAVSCQNSAFLQALFSCAEHPLFTVFIIFLRVIFTAAVIMCVAFIFYNSAQVAEVSSSVSGKFTVYLNKALSYLPIEITLSEHIVRKLAHIAEFAMLGLLFTFCLRVYTKRLIAFSAWPLLFGLFIAVCDEFLQRFVPGRSSQIRDIFIDFIGVCGGTAAAITIVLLLQFFWWLFFDKRRQASQQENI